MLRFLSGQQKSVKPFDNLLLRFGEFDIGNITSKAVLIAGYIFYHSNIFLSSN